MNRLTTGCTDLHADTIVTFGSFRFRIECCAKAITSGGCMSNIRCFFRLLFVGLLLLAETGCSTTSLKNLFVWNRKSDFHTIEELESKEKKVAEADADSSRPVKGASWNPFNRDDSAAADNAESRRDSKVAASDKQSSGFRMPFGGEESSTDDPFLHDESVRDRAKSGSGKNVQGDEKQDDDSSSRTARSTERPIRRTAADRADSLAETETAERLIPERSARSAGRSPRSELEEQKLAELDALLEGRELADARQTGRTAAATAARNAAAVKRNSELIAQQTRETAVEKKQAAESAARELQKSLADAELVFDEAEQPRAVSSRKGRVSERAEPLILRRPQAKRAIADQSATEESAEEAVAEAKSEDSENHDIESDTAVAAAETLFGDLQPGRQFSTRDSRNTPAAEAHTNDRKFGWKSSEPAATVSGREPKSGRAGAQGIQGPLRLAELQQEIGDENVDPLPTLDPLENTPDFDESPVSAPPRPAPTPGNRVRNNAVPSADPFIVPAAPRQKAGSINLPAESREADPVVEREEDLRDAEAGAIAAPAPGAGGGWMPPLSVRTWALAAAGIAVLALLFLPQRRRMSSHQTTVSQTSIA